MFFSRVIHSLLCFSNSRSKPLLFCRVTSAKKSRESYKCLKLDSKIARSVSIRAHSFFQFWSELTSIMFPIAAENSITKLTSKISIGTWHWWKNPKCSADVLPMPTDTPTTPLVKWGFWIDIQPTIFVSLQHLKHRTILDSQALFYIVLNGGAYTGNLSRVELLSPPHLP